MNDLKFLERDFGKNVLKSSEARAFFRSWRHRSATEPGSWSAIRKASFLIAGKSHAGVSIIGALRDHLAAVQGERCCYCRRRLVGIAYARPIDHVLPKNRYPQYTFNYRNLAVACFDCNHVKHKDNWSTWPVKRRRYLSERSCGEFFHARMHDFDEHIRYLHLDTNGASISVYAGLTPQGRQLCTALLKKSAGRSLATSANPRFAAALDKLRVQTEQMAQTKNDAALLDFMEALELAADAGI